MGPLNSLVGHLNSCAFDVTELTWKRSMILTLFYSRSTSHFLSPLPTCQRRVVNTGVLSFSHTQTHSLTVTNDYPYITVSVCLKKLNLSTRGQALMSLAFKPGPSLSVWPYFYLT